MKFVFFFSAQLCSPVTLTDMSVNSTFNSSTPSAHDQTSDQCTSVFLVFYVSSLLFLPLFILVLYLGCQHWKKRRSVTAAGATGHSDIFTYNMVVMEMISLLANSSYCYGAFAGLKDPQDVGLYMFSIVSPGQTLFHLLTCVERYVAVAHPVAYLGLRRAGGVRVRNVSTGCVWLFSVGSLCLWSLSVTFNLIYQFLFIFFASAVVSFCSLSILCILIGPGPGDASGNRKRVDQSKQRASYTIMVIMGALLLRFLGNVVFCWIYASDVIPGLDSCSVMWCVAVFSVPSMPVLPLLFLQRRRAGSQRKA